MSAVFKPKAVTANDLLEGDAVWLNVAGGWTRDIRKAAIIEDEAKGQSLLAAALQQEDVVVDAYLAEIRIGEDGPEPVHFREVFRTRGPSNYRHGKQEADNVPL